MSTRTDIIRSVEWDHPLAAAAYGLLGGVFATVVGAIVAHYLQKKVEDDKRRQLRRGRHVENIETALDGLRSDLGDFLQYASHFASAQDAVARRSSLDKAVVVLLKMHLTSVRVSTSVPAPLNGSPSDLRDRLADAVHALEGLDIEQDGLEFPTDVAGRIGIALDDLQARVDGYVMGRS